MLALTDALGRDVTDAAGAVVGRLVDLTVRLDHASPAVTYLVVRQGRHRERAIPWPAVAEFERSGVLLGCERSALPDVALSLDELWLMRDVVDTQIVDIAGRRLVRVSDVDLERDADALRLVAVDVGIGALLKRLGLRSFVRGARRDAVAWDDLYLASVAGHGVQLRAGTQHLRRLTAAQVAELLRHLPPVRGAHVLGALDSDRAADAVSASHPQVGGAVVDELGSGAAPILERMAPADAAVALHHVRPERRDHLLGAVTSPRAQELRRLLTHAPRVAVERTLAPQPARRRFRHIRVHRRAPR